MIVGMTALADWRGPQVLKGRKIEIGVPNELKKDIAVKGGTTEAAINIFERKALFKKIISQALKAAYNRSKKLGDD